MGSRTTTSTRIKPEHVIMGYTRFYHEVYGRKPSVRHLGGNWYQVNGEIVFHRALILEIEHLRLIARKKRQPEKSLVTRLINRLRNL
jgi:hypothetical protein